MNSSAESALSRIIIHLLVMVSGFATLSWEVIWQIKSSLALGVSAWGTAITLAGTMGGMSIGSILISRMLKDKVIERPVRLYGALEIIIGIAGLFLGVSFQALEKIDTFVYAAMPVQAWIFHLLGILGILGVPTVCMGATLPVFGLMARQFRTSIALLYSLNTLGATLGVLLAAFFFIPMFGIAHTIWIISFVNITAGMITWTLESGESSKLSVPIRAAPRSSTFSAGSEQWVVFMTGFATFALEISWFRALKAVFYSTTDAFAVMLAAVLLALGLSAIYVSRLQKKFPLGVLLGCAGVLILAVTPAIERFDLLPIHQTHPFFLLVSWFFWTFVVIGPPIFLLGVAFPWIINEHHTARRWGILNALNTAAAVAGSLGAAWFLLPSIGFARTAWLIGALIVITGIILLPKVRRVSWSILGLAGLLAAMALETGVGRTRLPGEFSAGKILEFYEGPEATVSAVDYGEARRLLVIDGFGTASQNGGLGGQGMDGYMAWMGHLPMLLHPDPKNALVICFGTGQTANAVRKENPQSLDIVDINSRVIKLAHNFTANEDVIDDPRTNVTIMDGRAYMRRTTKMYDIITLEPMPPNFAGVNSLYSREFYELASKKLTDKGIIAQWVPFHLISVYSAVSIARTFQEVFPNSILWNDPSSDTGVLLGSKDHTVGLGAAWPGFERNKIIRKLPEAEVRNQIILNGAQLRRYGETGKIITDDNQLLAYGKALYSTHLSDKKLEEENLSFLYEIASDGLGQSSLFGSWKK